MKKLILLLALAPSLYFSQNNNDRAVGDPIEQSIFSIGVKGGYGHSFVEPYQNYKFNSSWNAGLSAIYAPWTHWGIGLDAIYSREGVKLKTGDFTSTTELNYIRIPAKAIYFFRTYDKDFRPKVSLGPTFGFLLNDRGTEDFESFDFGVNATLGFNYRLARAIWLNVDASYYQGITDIYTYNSYGDHNGNIRLDVGLSFGF